MSTKRLAVALSSDLLSAERSHSDPQTLTRFRGGASKGKGREGGKGKGKYTTFLHGTLLFCKQIAASAQNKLPIINTLKLHV